jgi:hypothetical protein
MTTHEVLSHWILHLRVWHALKKKQKNKKNKKKTQGLQMPKEATWCQLLLSSS